MTASRSLTGTDTGTLGEVSASGGTATSSPARTRQVRSPIRAVALPSEHGGWGLTLEPVLLGLIVAPSLAGACLGLAAVLAFLARTPLKVILVDTHRHRMLDRTRLARRVLAGEGVAILALGAGALALAASTFWVPLVLIVPLVAVQLAFDMRSRSRRLLPELAGTVGIAGVAGVIVLAGGGGGVVAAGCWLVLGARAITSIPTVRDQVGRLHGRAGHPGHVLVADGVAVAVAAGAVGVTTAMLPGAIAVVAVIGAQRLWALRPTPRAVVLGIRQTVMGLVVVAATAGGVLAT